MIFNTDARGHELFPTGLYFIIDIPLAIYLIQLLLHVPHCLLVYWSTDFDIFVPRCVHRNFFDKITFCYL